MALRDLKISMKLGLGFAVVIALSVPVVVASLAGFGQANADVEALASENIAALASIAEARDQMMRSVLLADKNGSHFASRSSKKER